MSKVVSLWGQPTGEPDVQPLLVERLESLLEMARSGEIVGGTFAVLLCDGCANWYLAGKIGGYSLLGAMESAKAKVLAENAE